MSSSTLFISRHGILTVIAIVELWIRLLNQKASNDIWKNNLIKLKIMAKNKHTDGGFSFIFWIIIAALLSIPLCFLRFSKEKPSPVKDDERVQVHVVTDTLMQALETKAADWGTYDNDWSANIFRKETGGFIIEAMSNQKFYDILHIDSAATCIARDYPHLFHFEYTDEGSCRFRMAREQGSDGYVVLPTWLLVELIERNVLSLPTSIP